MKRHGIYFLLLVGLATYVWACSSEDNTDPVVEADRDAMLANLGSNLIIPSFESFKSSSATLQTAAVNFAAEPGNEEKLKAVQSAWLVTTTNWKRASLFSQGPIENNFLTFGIYSSTLNSSAIEKSIAQTGTTLDNAYIESVGAPQKGLPAIEYLIFDKENNSTVLSAFGGTNGARRLDYLKALCENLSAQTEKIWKAWSPHGENYVATFVAANGRDINSSFGVLSNKMIDMIYTIRDERLGAPMGKRNSGNAQPELVDARYSDESVELVKAELKSLEYTFAGKNLSGADGAGFDDILDKVGAKSGNEMLSAKIKNQIALINTKLDALDKPLSKSVVDNPADVNAIYEEVKRLQVLMEVDMINNLGVLLTFSDNDGD